MTERATIERDVKFRKKWLEEHPNVLAPAVKIDLAVSYKNLALSHSYGEDSITLLLKAIRIMEDLLPQMEADEKYERSPILQKAIDSYSYFCYAISDLYFKNRCYEKAMKYDLKHQMTKHINPEWMLHSFEKMYPKLADQALVYIDEIVAHLEARISKCEKEISRDTMAGLADLRGVYYGCSIDYRAVSVCMKRHGYEKRARDYEEKAKEYDIKMKETEEQMERLKKE